jgi:hypothetical protein
MKNKFLGVFLAVCSICVFANTSDAKGPVRNFFKRVFGGGCTTSACYRPTTYSYPQATVTYTPVATCSNAACNCNPCGCGVYCQCAPVNTQGFTVNTQGFTVHGCPGGVCPAPTKSYLAPVSKPKYICPTCPK